MDKEKAMQIFEFINKYQHILYIPSSTVEKIKNIINEKMENDHIIILNPQLEDLFHDNVYILEFEEENIMFRYGMTKFIINIRKMIW